MKIKSLIFLLVTTLSPHYSFASELFNLNGGASFASQYLFRGLQRYDGVSLQPHLALRYHPQEKLEIEVTAWGQIPLQGARKRNDSLSEYNTTAKLNFPINKRTLFSLGNTSYFFPDKSPEVEEFNEIFTSAEVDIMLTPRFSLHYDYQRSEALYYQLYIHHRFIWPPFGEKFNLIPFADFGWVTKDDGTYGSNGLVQITYGLNTELEFVPFLVTPSIQITEAKTDSTESEIWFSIKFDLKS